MTGKRRWGIVVRFFRIFIPFSVISSCVQEDGKNNTPPVSIREIKNQYARNFRILKMGSEKVFISYIDKNKKDSVVYILYQNEKPKPSLSGEVHFIKIPVATAASLSLNFIEILSELGELGALVGIDHGYYSSNRVVREGVRQNKIAELCDLDALNLERTIKLKPAVLLINPSGDKRKDFDNRLMHAGVMPVVCADYLEMDPLGRAEWIRVFGLLFGREAQADSIFTAIKEKYLFIQKKFEKVKNKPTVFSGLKMGDSWFVPGGESYVAKLFSDAGSFYVWKEKKISGSISLSLEEVLNSAGHAQFWVNLHACKSRSELEKLDKRYTLFEAFKSHRLYNNNLHQNPEGGNPYFETGPLHPEWILEDLSAIFHPDSFPSSYLFHYYLNLAP